MQISENSKRRPRNVERHRRGCGLRAACCANLASYSRPAAARSPAAVQGAGSRRQGHLCRCEPPLPHAQPSRQPQTQPSRQPHGHPHCEAFTVSHSALAHQLLIRPQHRQPHCTRVQLPHCTVGRRQQPDDAAQGDQGPRGPLRQAGGHPTRAGGTRLPLAASAPMRRLTRGWSWRLTRGWPPDGWQVIVVFDGKRGEAAAETETDGGMRVGVAGGAALVAQRTPS